MSNIQETFLNERVPGFENAHKELLRQGWKEKKFTKSTKADLERAFVIFLSKQMAKEAALQGRMLGPRNLEEIRAAAEARIPELYQIEKGVPIIQFRMYTKPLSTNVGMNNYEEPEQFMPEEYHEQLIQLQKGMEKAFKEVAKIEKLASNAEKNAMSARNKPANVAGVYSQTATSIRNLAIAARSDLTSAQQAFSQSRLDQAQFFLNRAYQAMEQASQMKNKPVNILANMMARTSFGTRYQITPEGYKYRPEYEGVNKELKEYYNYIYGSKKGGRTHKRGNRKNRTLRK